MDIDRLPDFLLMGKCDLKRARRLHRRENEDVETLLLDAKCPTRAYQFGKGAPSRPVALAALCAPRPLNGHTRSRDGDSIFIGHKHDEHTAVVCRGRALRPCTEPCPGEREGEQP